jgi:hypothetical protein
MSGSHCPATLGTAAAGLNTFTHAAHLLTAFGACFAQFGARATNGQVLEDWLSITVAAARQISAQLIIRRMCSRCRALPCFG